jgi:hypothetical protein
MDPITRASNKAAERRKRRYLQHIAPDDDQQNVMDRGGPGINEELVLGWNVHHTDQLILAPMRPDEKLIRVTAGKHQSYNTSSNHATWELAIRHGANDLAFHQPALFPDGSRRPATQIEPLADCKPFFDNIMFRDEFNNQANVLDFLSGFGKTTHGNPIPANRVSLKAGTKNKKTGIQSWKLALADVPIADVNFILQVYHFAKKVWNGEDETLWEWLLDGKRQAHKKRLGVTIEDLAKSVRIAHHPEFKIEDADITIDFPATFHAEDLVEVLKRAGYEIITEHKCGLQCVKCVPPGHEGVIIKIYNKISETMQQGFARKDNIACKVAKLLSPSTAGLNAKTLDEKYNMNGITRLEITLPFYKKIGPKDQTTQLDMTWTYKQMYTLLGDAHKLLTDCLVSCSIHDHLVGMEQMVDRSIAVYFGDTFDYKKHQNFKTKNKKQYGSEWNDKWPDGFIVRTINSKTHKMNGVEIHAKLNSRTPDADGWEPFAIAAAACCVKGSKSPPTMMVCVAGLDKFHGVKDSLEQPLIRNLYFRAVPLILEPVFPRVQLQTYYIGVQKNEWEAINVRTDELKLNPAITPVLEKEEVLTEISIPENFSPDELPDMNDSCSELVELVSGHVRGIQYATQENMPAEPSQWSALKFGFKQGRTKKGEDKINKECIKFKFKGMWHWMPPASEIDFRATYFRTTSNELTADALANIQSTFHWGHAGFVCSIDGTTDAAEIEGNSADDTMSDAPPSSTHPGVIRIGNISKSGDIPISLDGHEIETGGFKQRGKDTLCYISFRGFCERFFVPKSIKDRLLAEAKCRSTDSDLDAVDYTLDFLAGSRLIRPDNAMIGVTGYANAEPRMWIVDALSAMQVLPPETSRSEGKRLKGLSFTGPIPATNHGVTDGEDVLMELPGNGDDTPRDSAILNTNIGRLSPEPSIEVPGNGDDVLMELPGNGDDTPDNPAILNTAVHDGGDRKRQKII